MAKPSNEQLRQATLKRRAIEAVIWGMPAVKHRARRGTGSTNAERDFEVMFRLYGPDKSFFDKVWQLPDIELTNV